jgi:hypothetical protein
VITRTAGPARGGPGARKAAAGAAAKKAAGAAAKKAAGVSPAGRQLEVTVVKFDERMQGRFLTGKEHEHEPRKADFFGNVEAIHAPVESTKVKVEFDKPPVGYSHITAQTMRLVSEPPKASEPAGTPSRTYMQAFDNAYVHRADATIQADRITFDSEKNLFWAYGDQGRDVRIEQYKGIGQQSNVSYGRAARFNQKTGEASVIDPQSVQFHDFKTAQRPKPDKPVTPKPPVKPKRSRMPNRTNVERRTFNGK